MEQADLAAPEGKSADGCAMFGPGWFYSAAGRRLWGTVGVPLLMRQVLLIAMTCMHIWFKNCCQ